MPNQFTSCLLHLLTTSELQNLKNNIALFTAMEDVYADNQWTVKYQVDQNPLKPVGLFFFVFGLLLQWLTEVKDVTIS